MSATSARPSGEPLLCSSPTPPHRRHREQRVVAEARDMIQPAVGAHHPSQVEVAVQVRIDIAPAAPRPGRRRRAHSQRAMHGESVPRSAWMASARYRRQRDVARRLVGEQPRARWSRALRCLTEPAHLEGDIATGRLAATSSAEEPADLDRSGSPLRPSSVSFT